MYLSITYTVETKIKWLVKGYDSYGFGIDKELYNLHTNHKKKKSIKNRNANRVDKTVKIMIVND